MIPRPGGYEGRKDKKMSRKFEIDKKMLLAEGTYIVTDGVTGWGPFKSEECAKKAIEYLCWGDNPPRELYVELFSEKDFD